MGPGIETVENFQVCDVHTLRISEYSFLSIEMKEIQLSLLVADKIVTYRTIYSYWI